MAGNRFYFRGSQNGKGYQNESQRTSTHLNISPQRGKAKNQPLHPWSSIPRDGPILTPEQVLSIQQLRSPVKEDLDITTHSIVCRTSFMSHTKLGGFENQFKATLCSYLSMTSWNRFIVRAEVLE